MNEVLALVIIVILFLLAILFQGYWFMKKINMNEALLLQADLMKEKQSFTLPLKLEAYQRAILYLERIHPTTLVLRLNQPNLSARAMEAIFLKALRDEYDHNVAQQLYVSESSWNLLKKAKEETARLISLITEQLPNEADSAELCSSLIQRTSEISPLPSEIALEALKAEFQRLA